MEKTADPYTFTSASRRCWWWGAKDVNSVGSGTRQGQGYLFLLPRPCRPSWGMCTVIECTENNNKLSPSIPSAGSLSPPFALVEKSATALLPSSHPRFLRFASTDILVSERQDL
ncbi:hypothetical protein KM043_004706 [Ampulex compressa]|nr:hypothetical protein KM043_004706 [Ampulex compressa]